MTTFWVATIYCSLLILASLLGGWVALKLRLTHARMQVAISFVAGVMLGVALLHLLPHGFFELVEAAGPTADAAAYGEAVEHAMESTVAWMLGGFLLMFFLERFFHFHHHDAPGDSPDPAMCDHPDYEHGHQDAGHSHATEHAGRQTHFTWGGAAVGMTLHSLVDGIALAAAIVAEQHGDTKMAWAGAGTFVAIFLHKPFDSLAISTLMAHRGLSRSTHHLVNVLYALVAPVGVALFLIGSISLGEAYSQGLGRALGFAAGAFLCIATSDLLPELQFHRHDRGKLSLALLLGIALAWSIGLLEHAGHGHQHAADPHPAHVHAAGDAD